MKIKKIITGIVLIIAIAGAIMFGIQSRTVAADTNPGVANTVQTFEQASEVPQSELHRPGQ
ncbi:MAG TPA: hypothetical protein VGB30_14995 [bacterium]|jgi:hypothetical protein